MGVAIHGLCRHPLYTTWTNIVFRCTGRTAPDYANYGGRGITICPEWRHDFPRFLADIGERPFPGHQLDRIDNDKGYEPGNVRWVTPKTQQNNKRTNRRLTHSGRTQTLTQWAHELGMKSQTIEARMRRGWPVMKALTTKPRKHTIIHEN